MYNNILLAADGSDNSYRAAEETLHFINEGTQVTILNVIDAESSKNDVLHSGPSESIIHKRKENSQKSWIYMRKIMFPIRFSSNTVHQMKP